MDQGYQCYRAFHLWQEEERLFICRIKAGTQKTIITANPVRQHSIVFYDTVELLGSISKNRTEKPVLVVAYDIAEVEYWIATTCFDLSAEQITDAYQLRWDIENFFA